MSIIYNILPHLPVQAYRAFRQRGARQLAYDAILYFTENFLHQYLWYFLSRRLIIEDDLADYCNKYNMFFEYYDGEEAYSLELPKVPGGYDSETRDRMLSVYGSEVTIKPPYVCEVDNAALVGPDALLTKNNNYIFDNSLEINEQLSNSFVKSVIDLTIPLKSNWLIPKKEYDIVVSLVGPWTHNYTHWFQDYLTRLEGLEYYCENTENEVSILIPADASDWMRDSLQAVGYGPEKWIEWEGGRAVADRVIVSSVRREERTPEPPRRTIYSPTGIQWARDRILKNISAEQTVPHSDRIYLSRSDSLTRRVRNENEVLELLKEWDFKCYHPERLSFAEQVTLFSDAEIIVSPHGSGLMNQIFAENAFIIELMGKKQTVTTPATEYYYAELLGHNYACVPGESIGADLRTNISDLRIILEEFINK